VTAILRPGDKIHLAFGVDPHVNREMVQQEALIVARNMTEAYAAQGVTIVRWTANTTLSHPVVVAVFRD
jgi:hypothetical protein